MKPISRILIVFPLLSMLAGCGLFPPTLVDQGVVKIEIQESEPVRVSSATAYRDDGLTVVRGEARFPSWVRHGIFKGHIDIGLILPNGEITNKYDIQLRPRNRPRMHGRRASFISRFDIDPPRGTIARIGYHDGAHESNS
tara:strand:- start:1075 stop:1494 length:420 start_codon:yes stop_codon:yes gene_type:complete